MTPEPEKPKKEDLAQSLQAAAATAFRSGDMTTARRAMRRYVLALPGAQPGYANLTAVERRVGTDLEALGRQALRALCIAPENSGPAISVIAACSERKRALPRALTSWCARLAMPGRALSRALANLQFRLGRPEDAEHILSRALILEPGAPELLVERGLQRQEAGEGEVAPLFARAVCAADPGSKESFEAHNHLAALLHAAGRLLPARDHYRAALAMSPGADEVRVNLAAVLVDCGEAKAAEAELRRALVSSPADRDALWLSSCLRIGGGDRDRGYRAHHIRWSDPFPGARTHLFSGMKLWSGQPVAGRRILVWGDFGIGDEIIFAPLAEWLAREGADITLEADPRLVGLLARSYPEITIVGRQSDSPPEGCFDYHVPSALLARFYHARGEAEVLKPFLPDGGRVEEIRARLAAHWDGPRIGFAWGGGNKRTSWSKSTDLADWEALLTMPGLGFCNLQYTGAREADLPGNLFDAPLGDIRNDLDGLAALIAALDATVSISGINAHMAGALRKPGFILMPRLPLWFWGRSGARSDWYPSLHLFRREEAGWEAPIRSLTEEVRRFLSP